MVVHPRTPKVCLTQLAFQETLDLLEWSRLCAQLASFASTALGRRACLDGLIPVDLESSRRYLAETLELSILDQELEGGLSFYGVNDIGEIVLKCSKGGVVSGIELLAVAETLRSARRLRRQIDDPTSRPMTSSLLANLSTLPDLQRVIEFVIEDGGLVADRSSELLSKLRRKLRALREQRKDYLKEVIRKNQSILQDTVISERFNRPVLALKAGANGQIAGTVHDSSATGNTVFLEPKVVITLGNEIVSIEGKILIEEQRLLLQLSKDVGEHFLSLDKLCQIMMRLDFALARARYGEWLEGVPPEVKDDLDAPFFIHQFRHPLLVWQQHFENGDEVIPISFEISSGLKVVSITGPNTGGKTVAIKSLGLAILMARFGLLLPCFGKPSMPWCDLVLADIGDEQSLQQNLSTFSSHIVRIRRILSAISMNSKSSVVLLDELGAGTDPTEGTALATALLFTLADRARLTIATTHFGELKALKYNDSRFENASVGFNSDTLTPTFHLQWGIPGRSNALAIAGRLGLEEMVIQSAQSIIRDDRKDNVNNVIAGLEEQKRKQQEAVEDAVALLARTELLYEELMQRWKTQCKEAEDFQESGRHQLELSIREGQKEVKQLIKRLRDDSADGEIARKAGQRLKQIEDLHRSKENHQSNMNWLPQKGDRVRLSSIGKSGKVIGVSEDGSQVSVMCGQFRSTVNVNDVESLDGQKPIYSESVVKIQSKIPISSTPQFRTKRNTIDVRGLRVNEAEAVVEEKLRNLTEGPVWLIHGIGTGRLKKGLIQWLSDLEYVDKVTAAEQRDGGAGCSVIWLK